MNWKGLLSNAFKVTSPGMVSMAVNAFRNQEKPQVPRGVSNNVYRWTGNPATPNVIPTGTLDKNWDPSYGPGDKNLVPPPPVVLPPQANAFNPMYQTFLNNVWNPPTEKQPVPPPSDLASGVQAASKKYGIPPDLMYAIAHKESGFQNIPQHGGGNGRGYFQIDLGYHPDVTEQQAFDPMFAADYAGNMINDRLNKFSKTPTPVSNAIRAYNGGITNPKTAKYLQGVIDNLKNFSW